MELYLERGYEQTTVADIGERAGVTARTFFRYFADKREVLFAGSDLLEQAMVEALDAAPASASPMTAVQAALEVAGSVLVDREFSGRRQSVIVANPELKERELIKMASLSSALADGLRRRGVSGIDAALAAEAGVALFKVAFEQWLADPAERTLGQVLRDSADQLRALTAVPEQ